MARKQCDMLASQDNAELRAVCSTEQRSQTIAETFKTKYGVTYTTTQFATILADADVDVVFLCTPDQTHSDYIVAALQAGKHVFCEKPVGRTIEEFQLVRDQLEASDRVLQVGMNCRFREQYYIAQERIGSGEFGGVRFLRGTYIYHAVTAVRNGEKAWALDCPPGVFTFVHGGIIHCLDLMRWIGGEVASVFARATNFELAEQWKADTFSISLAFANGAIGELLASGAAFRPNDLSLEVWLERGSIIGTNIYHRDGDTLRATSETLTIEQKATDLALQFQDMVRAIELGKEPLNSFNEAYGNFKVLTAIEKSFTDRRVIPLTLGGI